MRVSLDTGSKAGMLVGLGIAFGSLTWSTLSVFGVGVLIINSKTALFAIKIFGGFYLLWMAFNALQAFYKNSGRIHDDARINRRQSTLKYFFTGYLIMLANPKAPLAWVAIVSLGIQNDSPLWVGLAIIFGTFIIALVAYLGYAFLFSSRVAVNVYSKASRYIQLAFSIFFAGAGMALLLNSLVSGLLSGSLN